MGKREQKINEIKKYIKNVAGNWNSYTYGSIPNNLISNACSCYAGAISKEDILGLIDITVLGTGNKGMIFTEHKVYYDNGLFGNKGSISYKKINETGKIPGEVFDSAYNKTALLELLSSLARIEASSIINEIDGMLNSMNEGTQRASDMIDKGMDLLESGKELFGMLNSMFGGGNNK